MQLSSTALTALAALMAKAIGIKAVRLVAHLARRISVSWGSPLSTRDGVGRSADVSAANLFVPVVRAATGLVEIM